MGKHTTVSIKVDLAQKLDEIIENDPSYNNRSELVRDALRRFLKDYEWLKRAKEVSYHGKAR